MAFLCAARAFLYFLLLCTTLAVVANWTQCKLLCPSGIVTMQPRRVHGADRWVKVAACRYVAQKVCCGSVLCVRTKDVGVAIAGHWCKFAELLFEAASCSFNPHLSSFAVLRRREEKKNTVHPKCATVVHRFSIWFQAISCLKILLFYFVAKRGPFLNCSCTDPTVKTHEQFMKFPPMDLKNLS